MGASQVHLYVLPIKQKIRTNANAWETDKEERKRNKENDGISVCWFLWLDWLKHERCVLLTESSSSTIKDRYFIICFCLSFSSPSLFFCLPLSSSLCVMLLDEIIWQKCLLLFRHTRWWTKNNWNNLTFLVNPIDLVLMQIKFYLSDRSCYRILRRRVYTNWITKYWC